MKLFKIYQTAIKQKKHYFNKSKAFKIRQMNKQSKRNLRQTFNLSLFNK